MGDRYNKHMDEARARPADKWIIGAIAAVIVLLYLGSWLAFLWPA